MHCIKIHLVYGTIKIIMDLSLNFIKADIILLNKLYWFLIFIKFCNAHIVLLVYWIYLMKKMY